MSLLSSILQLFPSFQPGSRLIDGGDLSALANQLFSTKTGITALAGGGQTGATPLPAALNRIDTVASGNDSVMLPQAIPGTFVFVKNNTATSAQVFGIPNNPVTGVGDTIATNSSNTQVATGTGVALAGTKLAIYVCFEAGKWQTLLTA